MERQLTALSFNQFLNEEKLMGSKCMNCGALHLPPRPICTKCQSSEMGWVEMSGKGRLIAFTSISTCPTCMIQEGYGRENPYCTGIVELEDGVRIATRIIGLNACNPEQIEIGTPVYIDFIHKGEGENKTTLLAFGANSPKV